MNIIRIGDTFTIAGVHEKLPNPDRRWWQFWIPKFVPGDLLTFTVSEAGMFNDESMRAAAELNEAAQEQFHDLNERAMRGPY